MKRACVDVVDAGVGVVDDDGVASLHSVDLISLA